MNNPVKITITKELVIDQGGHRDCEHCEHFKTECTLSKIELFQFCPLTVEIDFETTNVEVK